MLLPEGLPNHLLKYQQAKDEKELFALLKQSPPDCTEFFVFACEDETWCEKFPSVIKSTISWLTAALLDERIDRKLAEKPAQAIQDRYTLLKQHLEPNLSCSLRNDSLFINSLLFQALSLPFYYLIRKECHEKQQNNFEIKTLTLNDFQVLEEFILTGQSHILWKIQVAEVPRILKLALQWGLPGLAAKCENILVRDLTDENAFDMLAMSCTFPLEKLKSESLARMNTWLPDVQVSLGDKGHFTCAVQQATEASLSLFERFTPYITALVCGPQLIEEKEAIAIAAKCRRLTALDLTQARALSELLPEIAPHIKQLNLTGCPWLTDATFKQIVQTFPYLEDLNVGSALQLSAAAWTTLISLRHLRILGLSRCFQLSDAELKLILNAGRTLEELDLSECRQISPQGFHALAHSKRTLLALNLGRTELSDESLLEIAASLPQLAELNLTRCQQISEKGIIETIRLTLRLRSINLTQVAISEEALRNLRQAYPLLEILAE